MAQNPQQQPGRMRQFWQNLLLRIQLIFMSMLGRGGMRWFRFRLAFLSAAEEGRRLAKAKMRATIVLLIVSVVGFVLAPVMSDFAASLFEDDELSLITQELEHSQELLEQEQDSENEVNEEKIKSLKDDIEALQVQVDEYTAVSDYTTPFYWLSWLLIGLIGIAALFPHRNYTVPAIGFSILISGIIAIINYLGYWSLYELYWQLGMAIFSFGLIAKVYIRNTRKHRRTAALLEIKEEAVLLAEEFTSELSSQGGTDQQIFKRISDRVKQLYHDSLVEINWARAAREESATLGINDERREYMVNGFKYYYIRHWLLRRAQDSREAVLTILREDPIASTRKAWEFTKYENWALVPIIFFLVGLQLEFLSRLVFPVIPSITYWVVASMWFLAILLYGRVRVAAVWRGVPKLFGSYLNLIFSDGDNFVWFPRTKKQRRSGSPSVMYIKEVTSEELTIDIDDDSVEEHVEVPEGTDPVSAKKHRHLIRIQTSDGLRAYVALQIQLKIANALDFLRLSEPVEAIKVQFRAVLRNMITRLDAKKLRTNKWLLFAEIVYELLVSDVEDRWGISILLVVAEDVNFSEKYEEALERSGIQIEENKAHAERTKRFIAIDKRLQKQFPQLSDVDRAAKVNDVMRYGERQVFSIEGASSILESAFKMFSSK